VHSGGTVAHDRQLDVVLHHVEKLTELVYRTHTMAAAAVAAVALPPDVDRKLSEPVKKEFETRVHRCMYFGSAIKSAHDRGYFPGGGRQCCGRLTAAQCTTQPPQPGVRRGRPTVTNGDIRSSVTAAFESHAPRVYRRHRRLGIGPTGREVPGKSGTRLLWRRPAARRKGAALP
jgi:hypothetical protein